jgi:hypothetical protein
LPTGWRDRLGPTAKAARRSKPFGARRSCLARSHHTRDRCDGAASDVGNSDKVGRNGGGEHQRGKASLPGKVAGGGTHRRGEAV